MNLKSLKAAVGTAHERNVTVRTTNGRQITINHPDFVAFAQDSTEFLFSCRMADSN